MKRKRGLFITFEGPEGSGKTTQSRLLAAFLAGQGYRVLYIREPGGTIIGEKIRRILLDAKNSNMSLMCEMLLYMAARAQLIKEKISPAIREGKIVICDRFMDATLAYQGYAGGLETDFIKEIGRHVTEHIVPDLTILLDIDARAGLKRSRRKRDRIEKRSLSYHNKVRKGYLEIARRDRRRVKVIKAGGTIAEIQERIRKEAGNLLWHSRV